MCTTITAVQTGAPKTGALLKVAQSSVVIVVEDGTFYDSPTRNLLFIVFCSLYYYFFLMGHVASSSMLKVEAVFESACTKINRVLTDIEESLIVLQLKYDVPTLEFSDITHRYVVGLIADAIFKMYTGMIWCSRNF